MDNVPNRYKEAFAFELRKMFAAKSIEEARNVKTEIIAEYSDVAEKATETLESGFEESMTAKCLPESLEIKLRTTNALERLNRELKRRSDAIQIFPNSASVMRLMGAVTIEISNSYMSGNSLYAEKSLEKLRADSFPKLRLVALEQLAILKAA